MIGNLYEYVKNTIVGSVPMEFEFIIPVIVIVFSILIIYACFSGFTLLNYFFKRK